MRLKEHERAENARSNAAWEARRDEMEAEHRLREQEMAARQAEMQADLDMRERELELNRTENCLLCGTPVNTGRGSGFWFEGQAFAGAGFSDFVAGIRELLQWRDNPIGGSPHNPGWMKAVRGSRTTPDPRVWLIEKARAGGIQFEFDLSDKEWQSFEAAAKPFLDDCAKSAASQNAIGPFCSKSCLAKALASDPELLAAQADRDRIAAAWRDLSADPVYRKATVAFAWYDGFKKNLAKEYAACVAAADARDRAQEDKRKEKASFWRGILVCVVLSFVWSKFDQSSGGHSFWGGLVFTLLVFGVIRLYRRLKRMENLNKPIKPADIAGFLREAPARVTGFVQEFLNKHKS